MKANEPQSQENVNQFYRKNCVALQFLPHPPFWGVGMINYTPKAQVFRLFNPNRTP